MNPQQSANALLARIREFFSKNRVNNEMDEEIRFHLDQEIEFNIARGMSADEARTAALNAFGGVQRYRQETRETRGFASLDSLLRDTRLAFRRLRRAPVYSLSVVVTLAIGLGVATGIGALVYGVMLRPLPYEDPDRIVSISILTPGMSMPTNEQSAGTFVYFASRAQSFSVLSASSENAGVSITDGDAPERVTGANVTPNIFSLLNVKPAVGRLLRDDDVIEGFNSAVVISYDLWQRRYGGTPDVVGKQIELNRIPREILGVLPQGFAYPSRSAAIYFPRRIEATRAGLTNRNLVVIGRLKPGVSVEQARAEINTLIRNIREQYPELPNDILASSGLSAKVETLQESMIAPVRPELTLLGIMIGVLLLIAFANVATLSLLRAQRLRTEVAISRALGAGHYTMVQRFVVEGVLVSLAGGLLALPIAILAVATRFGLTDAQIPRLSEVAITPTVAALLVTVALVIGTMIGLLSVARASGGGGTRSLRVDARTARGQAWRRAQEGLVTVQIALALSLLLSAGLMASSLAKLNGVDIGFDKSAAAKFSFTLPFRAYPTLQRTAAFNLALKDALRAEPGVTGVAGGMQFPSTQHLLSSHPRLETTNASGETRQSLVTANVVTADFFKVMGIRVISGRGFERGDMGAASPGVVLGASLAKELFGAIDPVGREVRIASSKFPSYRVVGVSGDVYGDRLTDGPLRVLYFPLLGDLPPESTETEDRIPFMPAGMHIVVRSARPLSELAPMFRRVLSAIDPRVPMWDVQTLDQLVANTVARTRLSMLLLGIAAIATLLLGSIGLYSVIAYAVAGRSREFAVRLAIGASPSVITRQVLSEGVRVASLGILGGLALSYASAGVLRDLVYGISATDPLVYLGTAIVVLLCTVLSMYSPARRAGNTDPARALQGE